MKAVSRLFRDEMTYLVYGRIEYVGVTPEGSICIIMSKKPQYIESTVRFLKPFEGKEVVVGVKERNVV